jgi:pimeloyl-ACP methyl ester carboxylesterase
VTSWRRLGGVAGLAAGAAAAGAGAALAAQKIAVGRIRLRPDPAAGEPLGELRGRVLTVLADDGVPLHAEISGPDDAPVTIIFSHGYVLNQDVWHFQRAALTGTARLVFWDQRSHGRSGRSSPDRVSIDQLGSDLHAVLLATAPGDTPVVLVGHSMGGMAIMALAGQQPGLFGPKVAGVVLISTVASGVDPAGWLPVPLLRTAARQCVPLALRGLRGRPAALIDRGRSTASDLGFLGTRYLAFGDPRSASPAVIDYLERIIRATPVQVVADFYLALLGHDKRDALGVLGRVPVVIMTGERDRIVSARLSDELAAALPDAERISVPGAGHVVLLERPGAVNEAISGLVARLTAPAQPGRERPA